MSQQPSESNRVSRSGWRGYFTAGVDLLAIAVVAAGLLTLIARNWWIADLAANLRLQLVIAGIFVCGAAVVARRWKWMSVQAALLLMHSFWFVLPPARAETAAPSVPADLTVTAVNVYFRNSDHDTIAQVLEQISSDVIAVVEIRVPLFEHLVQQLADTHPYVQAQPEPGAFGVVVFSRYPLSEVELVGPDKTGGSMLVTVTAEGRRYRVAAVHPIAPMLPEMYGDRNQHLQQLAQALASWSDDHPDDAQVAIGDFNLTPWSPLFSDFMTTSRLKHVSDGAGIEPSWHALPALPFGLVLDHCLVSDQLRCVSCRFGPTVHSDHRPLTVGLIHHTNP